MIRVLQRRRKIATASAGSLMAIAVVAASVVIFGQEQSAVYVFAMDAKGVPVLDIEAKDLSIKEDKGPSTIVSVRRFGWPMKVTVLLDNGYRTGDALVHYRSGLKKFFEGLPREVSVSLIATSPNPRWLFRDTKDRVQIEKGVNLITTEPDSLGRFSDSLIEYSKRLDEEFRNVTAEQLPPYLPVMVSIATTHQDGSHVNRESNRRMIESLRKHRTWTNMIMVAPGRPPAEPGQAPVVEADEGQNAEIAKIVQEATRGRYTPIGSSGTSALASKLLPEMAQEITARYIRQMTQYRVIMERPAGASGPMKNFALTLLNRPGAKLIVSTDGNMP